MMVAAVQAAAPPQAVIPSGARNLALSIFNAVRDSSSSANKNGGLLGMTGQTGFPAACLEAHLIFAPVCGDHKDRPPRG